MKNNTVLTFLSLIFVSTSLSHPTTARADDWHAWQHDSSHQRWHHHEHDDDEDDDGGVDERVYQTGHVYYHVHGNPYYMTQGYYTPWDNHAYTERSPYYGRSIIIGPRDWDPHATPFHVGQILPYRAGCHQPVAEILRILPPAHDGRHYVQVDQSIYLVSDITREIVKALIIR